MADVGDVKDSKKDDGDDGIKRIIYTYPLVRVSNNVFECSIN